MTPPARLALACSVAVVVWTTALHLAGALPRRPTSQELAELHRMYREEGQAEMAYRDARDNGQDERAERIRRRCIRHYHYDPKPWYEETKR